MEAFRIQVAMMRSTVCVNGCDVRDGPTRYPT